MRVGLATYYGQKFMTNDDQMVFPYLEKVGVFPMPFDWRRSQPPSHLDAIITRSCWDFGNCADEFINWINQLSEFGRPVLNPPDLLMWNHSKRYLLELADRGVLMPATKFLPKGTQIDGSEIHEMTQNFKGVILKPAISVCGFDTYKFNVGALSAIVSQTNQILKTRDVIIQDFLPEIHTNGEISFVFFRGQFSHAVKKRPKPGEFRIQEEHGGQREPYLPSLSLLDQAYEYLSFVNKKTLFARVDCIEKEGMLYLIELELIHPMLFLKYDRFAAQRFASAIVSELLHVRDNNIVTSA